MSRLLPVKLRRDLRASWSRFVLMVLALAVSLTVFGAMLFAWSSISRETSAAYMSTEPASATIVLDDGIEVDQMASIAAEARTQPGVLEATGRTQFISTIEVNGESRDRPLMVFAAAPDDPMRMAKFDVQQEGNWPLAVDEILIKADSLAQLGMAVGDTVTVETPSGETVQLRVSGSVYDPSLAPSLQELRGYGYLTTASLASLGQPALLDQLKLQIADPGQTAPSRDRDAVAAVASDVGEWLQQEYGLTVDEIQVPEPYEHPHEWQADVLLGSLLAGGAAALLLATILVANMLNNLFTQQIPQIGIMKAIGAPSGSIGRLYLAMTLLVAAAATLLAVPPAILIGQSQLESLLVMLGIEPVSPAAPWSTYLAIVAVGLCLPPLMALIPLVKASRTTVRAAIDHRGLGSKPSAATGVLARLSRVNGLDRGLVMALRNTVRRPARFWLSVGLLASAGAVFVAGMSLSSGTRAVDEERIAQRYWDVEAQLADPALAAEVISTLYRVPEISRVEAWYGEQTSVAEAGQLPVTSTYPDQGHGSISVNTVLADPTLPPPELLEGRWLKRGEIGAVVLNQITRDKTVPDLGAGDTVQLFIGGQPTTWRVVGIVEERDSSGGGVFVTAEGLAEATGQPQRVNQLRISTDSQDEQTRQAVADAVDDALTDAGIKVGLTASVSRGSEASSAHLGPVLTVLLGVALPMGLIGGIGLASTMSANILDRYREFGVMHAIGARPKAVRRIVVAEGIFLALTSCIVAVIPALALTSVLGTGLGNIFMNAPLPYRISLLAVGIWIALAVLGAALATEAAAARASRITVREALTYV